MCIYTYIQTDSYPKHAKVNKQKGTKFLQSTAEYPHCVTHLQEMKKIRINTTYTEWAQDAITSL